MQEQFRTEFEKRLKEIGISAYKFAQLTGTDYSKAKRWKNGKTNAPKNAFFMLDHIEKSAKRSKKYLKRK